MRNRCPVHTLSVCVNVSNLSLIRFLLFKNVSQKKESNKWQLLALSFSSTATKVLMLGSGELGKEVVIELQRLGVEVVACDRYENAPAMQVADRGYVLNAG